MYIVEANAPRFNILLYGPPGIGKTWLASTAQDHPSMGDILFLNIEGGLITIAGRGDIRAINIIGIEPFKPTPEMTELPLNCSTLEDEFWKLANRKGDYENIHTVVIDSGSECQTLNLECIVNTALLAKKNKNRDNRDEIWQEDYGKSNNQLKRLFRWFRDLDINCIITALPQQVFPKTLEGKVTSIEPVEVKPQFTAKLAEAVMGYMDMVWYMYEDDKGQRYILTQKTGIFRAKTRGVKFSKEIGPKVAIKNIFDPSSSGLTLADLYDLWIRYENQ